jgi:cell division protein FtsA
VAKARTGLIGALDIGSSKITCFIAHATAGGIIRVVGIGHHASGGVRSGAIVDMEAAQNAILTTVSAAEEAAGERLREVVINISGGKPSSHVASFETSLNGHPIGDADLRRLHLLSTENDPVGERQVIHSIPIGYTIDGSNGIRDPRGMYGDRIAVKVHTVSAASGAVRNLLTCVARCHLDIADAAISPYASGLACLVEDEIDLGATLIDMGGGTTSVAVFYDGHVVHGESIPCGGGHVTHDIARGLSTSITHAERMKTLYGGAIASPTDEREYIDVPLIGEEAAGQSNHIPRSLLVGIIRPRIEEILELVRDQLERNPASKLAGRRLVLTGGASQLGGVRELAALILEKQVRIGRPLRVTGLAEATSGPAFSTCAGLLRYVVEKGVRSGEARDLASEGGQGRLSRLGQWLKENF